eukprot:CAMPEP_0204268610 /NCGR_PEP_ID=MMETSP0468-20130131/13541_1 /ASSEMBLY_ACC=CAM_ASM_000383 /TAXON_ID=2969 /ORGANISM="Oxyrrhis marina" /LENGTH=51 /DNA_ID=CAMNT_0051243893 /DNA_START=202 /DNA_END=357 /DNA_ORIENTATION=+
MSSAKVRNTRISSALSMSTLKDRRKASPGSEASSSFEAAGLSSDRHNCVSK